MIDTKVCRKCKIEKPAEDFYKDKRIKSGLRSQCKQCDCENKRKDYVKDPQKFLDRRKAWGEANQEYWAAYNRERHKRYYPANKDKYRARSRVSGPKHRAKRQMRVPPWLTEEHKQLIKQFYDHARDCEIISGERYHVDHIVPLNGKDVCGLHVPWNLQVLPADINQRKSNKHESSIQKPVQG